MIKRLLTLFCTFTFAFAAWAERPNIVFILADDLGYTDLACYGSDFYRTPHLDRFAKQSLLFTDAYANCSNCAPTRAALMSGMYAPRTGVYTVGDRERGRTQDRMLISSANQTQLFTEVITLAESLKAQGYATAHIGKWHLGPQGSPTGPKAQGFDINIAGNEGGSTHSFFSPYRNPAVEDGPEGEYLTERLSREAVNYLKTQATSDSPFFLYLSFYSVHTPIQAEADVIEKVKQREKGENHQHIEYAAMVECMDRYSGRVLDAIDDLDLAENTIVIFASDNGGHGTYTNSRPLRGGKGMFYEGGIRVPLMVRWPGVTKAGAQSDEPILLFDLYPTLVEAAGGVLPETQPIDGIDLSPILRDAEATLEREAIFFHFPTYLQAYRGGMEDAHRQPWRATPCSVIRAGDWKLIEYFETGEVELFNLKDDLGEQTNLAKRHPEKADDLLKKLKQWQQETGSAIPTEKNPRYEP